MEVEEGAVLLVNIAERTGHGWVWAEVPDAKEVPTSGIAETSKLGWVPMACLEWSEG